MRLHIIATNLESFMRENNEYRLLLEIIEDACRNAETPQDMRPYLEKGIGLTKMSAEELSKYAFSLGFPELAQDYHSYSQDKI